MYVNKIPQKKHIFPPTVQELFNCDEEMKTRMENISFKHTEAVSDKGSLFQGHAVNVKSSQDVRAAYRKIKLLYPESDHIILAYAVKNYTGHHDHGEHMAGSKILQVLLNRGRNNTVLFITREYGGAQLGQCRFIHIECVA